MRSKRLQHVADTLCHMFCGWRLIDCYPALERLGSGTLVIDVLTETCTHNGRPVGPLRIAAELRAWLRKDLAANRVELDALREASVTAKLAFGTVRSDQRLTQDVHVYPDGRSAAPAQFVACDIACQSRVVTDEVVYTSAYTDREEWPPGWPLAAGDSQGAP